MKTGIAKSEMNEVKPRERICERENDTHLHTARRYDIQGAEKNKGTKKRKAGEKK